MKAKRKAEIPSHVVPKPTKEGTQNQSSVDMSQGGTGDQREKEDINNPFTMRYKKGVGKLTFIMGYKLVKVIRFEEL